QLQLVLAGGFLLVLRPGRGGLARLSVAVAALHDANGARPVGLHFASLVINGQLAALDSFQTQKLVAFVKGILNPSRLVADKVSHLGAVLLLLALLEGDGLVEED